MYLRDPAGKLAEVDSPDASTLDRSVVSDVVRLSDVVPPGPEGRAARLYSNLVQSARGGPSMNFPGERSMNRPRES